ncbi:hypothetical protein RFUL19S_04521 [Rhizobacter fulvus]
MFRTVPKRTRSGRLEPDGRVDRRSPDNRMAASSSANMLGSGASGDERFTNLDIKPQQQEWLKRRQNLEDPPPTVTQGDS